MSCVSRERRTRFTTDEAQDAHFFAERWLRVLGDSQCRLLDQRIVLPRQAIDDPLHIPSHLFHDALKGQRLRRQAGDGQSGAAQRDQVYP